MGTYALVIIDENSVDIASAVFDRVKQVEDSLSSFLKEVVSQNLTGNER